MKSVLISIQPKWCELIANGKKTIEVRKTMPKIETPFKCYIYCTKKFYKKGDGYFQGKYCGKVIGEFVCKHITNIEVLNKGLFTGGYPNGNCTLVVQNSALTAKDINKYANGKEWVYGWHISDIKIYDEPKELGEFYTEGKSEIDYKGDWLNDKPLTRPPQSWCYVEEVNENDRA